MIERVRLENYISFGAAQEIPLEPITIIVGANNSGKTNFLRIVDFVRDGRPGDARWIHRPLPSGANTFSVGWDAVLGTTEDGRARAGAYELKANFTVNGPIQITQSIAIDNKSVFHAYGNLGTQVIAQFFGRSHNWVLGMSPETLLVNESFFGLNPVPTARADVRAIVSPLAHARHVHLVVAALREPNSLKPGTPLQPSGAGLSATLANWTLAQPDLMDEFNSIMTRCVPELRRVLVECPDEGRVRLLFEQRDGERFDSAEVSDGVMMFSGLVAHALLAPPNAILTIEEPERAIHPRRLVELVDVLRTLVHRRSSQFILATHSSALLNVFRDEPEAIVTFRRTARGTVAQRLSDVPELVEILMRSDPGEMLAAGVFNEDVASSNMSSTAAPQV